MTALAQSEAQTPVGMFADPFADGIRVVVADAERDGIERYWRVIESKVDGEQRIDVEQRMPISAMLDGSLWDHRPCDLVIEHAHLKPQGRYSLSQPLLQEELEQAYQRMLRDGVRPWAFPEGLAARARRQAGFGEKEKEKDPHAEIAYLRGNRKARESLKRWSPLTDRDHDIHAAANGIRKDMTARLNVARVGGDDYPLWVERERVLQTLYDICDLLSPEAQRYFKLEKSKTGKTKGQFKSSGPRWNQISTLWTAVYNDEGMLRLNPRGQFIGIRFIWDYLLLQHPYHGKGAGTGRSNLMHHGFRKYLTANGVPPYSASARDKAGLVDDLGVSHMAERVPHTAAWRRIIKEMLYALRDAGLMASDASTSVGKIPALIRPALNTSEAQTSVPLFAGDTPEEAS